MSARGASAVRTGVIIWSAHRRPERRASSLASFWSPTCHVQTAAFRPPQPESGRDCPLTRAPRPGEVAKPRGSRLGPRRLRSRTSPPRSLRGRQAAWPWGVVHLGRRLQVLLRSLMSSGSRCPRRPVQDGCGPAGGADRRSQTGDPPREASSRCRLLRSRARDQREQD